jgi:hypothetical protein
VASVGHFFQRRRAYATGIAAAGGSFGGIIFPLIYQGAIQKVGFGWSVRIIAFTCLGLMVGANIFIHAREEIIRQPSTTTTSSPSSSSSNPTSSSTPPKRQSAFSAAKIDLTAFKDPRFALTTTGIFLIEWAHFAPMTYITSYAIAAGVDSDMAYQLLVVLNVGSCFGRWLPGLVADSIGRFNTMLITVSLCLVTVLAFWLPAEYIPTITGREAVLVVFALLYGFVSGTCIFLNPVCVGQISSTKEYGTRYGTCYFFVSFAPLTGIPVAGQIVAANSGGYTGLVCFTAAGFVGAFVFFGAARIVGGGWGVTRY